MSSLDLVRQPVKETKNSTFKKILFYLQMTSCHIVPVMERLDKYLQRYPIQGMNWRNAARRDARTQLEVRGEFNKFPDFFVQAFCRRLLKIHYVMALHLWDDRPIFMISRSNEQLQQ